MKASRAQMKLLRQQEALRATLERIEAKTDALFALLQVAESAQEAAFDQIENKLAEVAESAQETKLAEVAAKAQEPMPDIEPIKAVGKKK